jgi:hypothetical protein
MTVKMNAPEFREEVLNLFDRHYEILCLENEQRESPTPLLGEVIDDTAQALAVYLGIGRYKGQTKAYLYCLLRAYLSAVKNLFPNPIFKEGDKAEFDKLTHKLEELRDRGAEVRKRRRRAL